MTLPAPERINRVLNAVLLAGERLQTPPLAGKFNLPVKALIPVGGVPMVQRVIEVLSSSGFIGQIFLCGPEKELFAGIGPIERLLETGVLTWVENDSTPSRSALKALLLAGRDQPVLVTTADHALLKRDMVDFFCSRALASGGDLLVGLARLETVKKRWPEARRTSYRFRDGRFCSCNLFGFLNKNSLNAVKFWQKVEEKRKNPLKIVGAFGWFWVLRYVSGTLSLEQAFNRASRVIGCSIRPVILPFAEAAIDVDSFEDWKLAEKILKTPVKSSPT